MANKDELLTNLEQCVLEMEEEQVIEEAQKYVDAGFDAYDGIASGLARGMEKAGDLFEQEEYFVPELLICSDAMYNGIGVLKPHLAVAESKAKKCPVIIGVVAGDSHDIGKNLVKIMLDTAGFEIHDLGCDVSAEAFVAEAKEVKRGILCLSTMMTTTMSNMKNVIDLMRQENLDTSFKIMVGGGPLNQTYADKIGADAYTANAAEAMRCAVGLARELGFDD